MAEKTYAESFAFAYGALTEAVDFAVDMFSYDKPGQIHDYLKTSLARIENQVKAEHSDYEIHTGKETPRG